MGLGAAAPEAGTLHGENRYTHAKTKKENKTENKQDTKQDTTEREREKEQIVARAGHVLMMASFFSSDLACPSANGIKRNRKLR